MVSTFLTSAVKNTSAVAAMEIVNKLQQMHDVHTRTVLIALISSVPEAALGVIKIKILFWGKKGIMASMIKNHLGIAHRSRSWMRVYTLI